MKVTIDGMTGRLELRGPQPTDLMGVVANLVFYKEGAIAPWWLLDFYIDGRIISRRKLGSSPFKTKKEGYLKIIKD